MRKDRKDEGKRAKRLTPWIKLLLSSFSFVELHNMPTVSSAQAKRNSKTHCAPSSPRPIGSSRTFTPSVSAKVSVTGIDPPSRVRSGVLL
jgi:hypothetical protein